MTTWTFPRAGKQYGAYARVPLCRACGNTFAPPGYSGCCTTRCVQYLQAASQPVLGDPLFGPQQPMLCRGGCGLRFESRGINLCVDCWDRSRSVSTGVTCVPTLRKFAQSPASTEAAPADPARHDDEAIDRAPARSLCHW
jgi:hypothetical protein